MNAQEATQSPLINKIPVAVLGATGAVGQTFIRLLENHPWFEVKEVAASQRSEGKTYAEATRWLIGEMPATVANLTVVSCTLDAISSPIVFSALDSSVAGEVEIQFAQAGRAVFSNAKNHRMASDVPLLIPEVNADHISVVEAQRKNRGWTGSIVTNSNCAAAVAAVALAPLHEKYKVKNLFLSTMQAISGAGYPGVASLDILANVIPYINDEEPKVEAEMAKLLGSVQGNKIVDADITVTSHTNRVPVENGHTVCMSIQFESRVTADEAYQTIKSWKGANAALNLPTRPEFPIALTDAVDRPQPKRDVELGNGMTVTVGRVRSDNIFDIRLVAMGSNTIRGAAGGSILNAELMVAGGMLTNIDEFVGRAASGASKIKSASQSESGVSTV